MVAFDGKLRRRIAWLNNDGGFDNAIMYARVVQAAEGLDEAKVMDVLKSLEDHWNKVWEPTSWVCSSLQKAKNAIGGLRDDVSWQLRKRIRWLNTLGGFENAIIFTKVAEAAVGLDGEKVMEILSYLENHWQRVEDPTAWVCSALRRAAAGGNNSENQGYGYGFADYSYGYADGYGDGYDERYAGSTWNDSWNDGWNNPWNNGWQQGISNQRGGGYMAIGNAPNNREALPFDEQLRRRIGWLNSYGGFENTILYSKVAEAAVGLSATKVMEILRHLENQWERIEDPTAWVCAGLNKSKIATNWGKVEHNDFTEQLFRRIRWLNGPGGFNNSLVYAKIAEAAVGTKPARAIEILKYLEGNWSKVGDPTAWVCTSLRKAKSVSSSLNPDFDKRLRARIGWLNNAGGFENSIVYVNVAEAVVGIPAEKVMDVLKNLEERASSVKDPTAWVCVALSKLRVKNAVGKQNRNSGERPQTGSGDDLAAAGGKQRQWRKRGMADADATPAETH